MTTMSSNPTPIEVGDHGAQQSPISIIYDDAFQIVVRAGYLTVRLVRGVEHGDAWRGRDPAHFAAPASYKRWYLYEGSLTSKPTREVVTWIVFPTSLDVASDDLRKIERHAHQPERDVQALNRRYVLRNF